MPVEEALLGFYPTASVAAADGSPAFDGMLVAAARETVLTNLQAVEAAGLRPVIVDLSGFALLRIMGRGALAAGTVAFVDIGSRGTTVVVAVDGMPQFVRALATGAQDLVDSFARATGLSLDDAAQVLRTRGLAATDAPEYTNASGPFAGVGEKPRGRRAELDRVLRHIESNGARYHRRPLRRRSVCARTWPGARVHNAHAHRARQSARGRDPQPSRQGFRRVAR